MAGFTTHYIFGKDMIMKLKDMPFYDLIKRHRNVYNLGLQGPDIFFYNFFIAGKGSSHRYGKMMHKSKVNMFFSSAIDFINNRYDDEFTKEVLSVYLMGMLGHNALDAEVHPYIYCRSGYLPEKNNSDETFGIHSLLELNIDKKYLLKNKETIPSQFYQHKTVLLKKRERKIIADFLSYCILRTYYKKKINDVRYERIIKRNVKFSIINYTFILRILHDKHGFKRTAVQLFEKHVLKNTIVSNIILTDNLKDDIDSLNLNHMKWHHPWNNKIVSSESFDELYKKAGDYYVNLINTIIKAGDEKTFVKDSSKKYILNLIKNRSYKSGIKYMY